MLNNCCQISPLVFIINILFAFYYDYILYGFLFLSLIITSIIHHTYYTEFTSIIDKISILYVILYGSMLFTQKNYLIDITNYISLSRTILLSIIIILTFLSIFYLYHYGYYNNKYCFDTSIDIAYKYHSLIHYISCLSHTLIIIL
mgnify:FL=1